MPGNVAFCGVFTPSQQDAILGTTVTGARASLGDGDYTCTFRGGPAGTSEVISTLELQCNKTDASGAWQEYTQQGVPVTGDTHGVRELPGSRGMAMGAMLSDNCLLTGAGGVTLGGKPDFRTVPALQSAMDQAVTANPGVG